MLHILLYPVDLLWAKSTEVFVLYAKSSGRDGLGHLGDLLEGLQEVVWAAN
jgi:hypothetical protein